MSGDPPRRRAVRLGLHGRVKARRAQAARSALARCLRHPCLDAGLAGHQLSLVCGWHPARTSRIGNTLALPSDAYIRAWYAACGAGRQAEGLDRRRPQRHFHGRGVETPQPGRAGLQQEIVLLVEWTRAFRVYQRAYHFARQGREIPAPAATCAVGRPASTRRHERRRPSVVSGAFRRHLLVALLYSAAAFTGSPGIPGLPSVRLCVGSACELLYGRRGDGGEEVDEVAVGVAEQQ